MKHLVSILAVAGLLVSGVAEAKPGDRYTYGNYTYSNLNGIPSSDREDHLSQSNSTFGLGAGYVVNDHFALELGYKDLGKLKEVYRHPVYDDQDNLRYLNQGHDSLTSKAIVLRAIGLLPLDNGVTLEGSVGAGVRRAEFEGGETDQRFDLGSEYDQETRFDQRHTSLIPLAGVGGSYAFTPSLSLFSRYEFAYKAVNLNQLTSGSDLPSIHSSTVDLGLRYTL